MRTTLPLLLLVLATPAFASDGLLEINQTCAVQTGCFAGDTPGFPVTITTPGTSYILTSRLIVPDQNTDGIVISASSVSIDLSGFEIAGPVTCSGTPPDSSLVCEPLLGSGSGVKGLGQVGLSVTNGSITGMGQEGLAVGNQAQITSLNVRWNAFVGIRVGNGSTISRNMVYQNGSDGISTSLFLGSIVSGNSVYQNGGRGIYASNGSTVSGNTVYQNGGEGINARGGSTVSGNTSYRNGGDGIEGDSVNGGQTIIDNTVYGNGGHGIGGPVLGSTVSRNTSYDNDGNGIWAGDRSNVEGNTVRNNNGWGLHLDFPVLTSTYRDNTISTDGVSLGTVLNGVDAGGNVCNGSLTCP